MSIEIRRVTEGECNCGVPLPIGVPRTCRHGPTDPREQRACTVYDSTTGHRFLRIDANNGSWTWELFEAHWADGHPPNVYIGR